MNWLQRVVEKSGYVSAKLKRATLTSHILPTLGSREFKSIGRRDIAELLDRVEDEAGPAAADTVLSVIRAIANWYASRDDNYVSPVVRGMRRHEAKPRARVLSDDEIRALWKATEGLSKFSAFTRLLLLTGQRRTAVASMRWEDVANGVWLIPTEERQKGRGGALTLPTAVLEAINAQPRFLYSPWVFPATRGENHFRDYDGGKAVLDAATGILEPWTLHDLRRTARSLMSRAGVRPDIAERVLGHAIEGVEGVYDRHSYHDEKAHALEALAGLIANIVTPPVENVVTLRS
jgi:integrase